ncbi:MAG: hypothetical protein RLZ04_1064 [Actinomycetota bacterium]
MTASLLVAACSSGDESATTSAPAESAAPTEPPTTDTVSMLVPATFTVRPGTEQIAIVDAAPGTTLSVVRAGEVIADGTVDEQGSLLFRELEPGADYLVVSETETTDVLTVWSPDDIPPQELYSEQQTLLPADGGFGYIVTRDGTTLSANVILPGPAADGPYPTVVEYSGYQPSDPDSAQLAAVYTAMGLAYVGVNMRGTGCSGGSYRFFETVQLLDGYDAIEAVAAQPWVLDNEVGMVGISYPGISQLFVASTRPPSLNSITPLSVLDDSARSTLYPGGILNTGFAVEWTSQRVEQAKPYGQEWSKTRADAGDTVCADNQELRLQNPDLLAEIEANQFYTSPLGDSLAPVTMVDKIEVPVFLAGAWQDEQTGGHFPAMLPAFTNTPHLYVSLVNGLHTESLSPTIARRYIEFLQLYVGKKVPDLSAGPIIAGGLGAAIWGTGEFGPWENRFEGMTFEEALAAFEAEKPVRVHLEQGGNPDFVAGTPEANQTLEFDSWPIPEVEAARWGLSISGQLLADGAVDPAPGSVSYTADPTALPATFLAADSPNIWNIGVKWDWQPLPTGTGVGFATAPLTDDLVLIGSASADLWITSSTGDTDLEVTISEIRPDGTEIYVQSGWLRASQRALDEAASSELRPAHTNFEADAAPLGDEPSLARVDIFPFAHVFRAGSRLRITVDAPGNARGEWEFRSMSAGETVSIYTGADYPSSIALPVVPGISITAPVPPACGSLRGQPCREYVPASNGG